MSKRYGSGSGGVSLSSVNLRAHRGLIVGIILFVALIAFEIFNFDTTQFALQSLLGNVTFIGLQWATILAVAFCAIDFAGLNRLFTPKGNQKEQREIWFLMGAWLLGATMNAVMTWWAVSVILLTNNLGNEVLNRQQLLLYVPIFVAVFVWLTRILFIGSFSIAGETILGGRKKRVSQVRSSASTSQIRGTGASQKASPAGIKAAPKRANNPAPRHASLSPSAADSTRSASAPSRSSRVRRRSPLPNAGTRRGSSGVQARTK